MRYPLYVISKGRSALKAHTARFLIEDDIDFKIVVEPQEADDYASRFTKEHLLITPFSNLGLGGIPARNFVWEHSLSIGAKRHWILDDNINGIVKVVAGKRTRCKSIEAFNRVEEFTDRFENIAISGLNYRFFVGRAKEPFILNHHVYSCLLILNELPFRWRGRYNEDTDLCLQALTNNWCTVNVNAYATNKAATMTCKGGNMEQLYKGNGRLKMSRSLEYEWQQKLPGVVKTTYKWGRPQHHVNWSVFKTQLKPVAHETMNGAVNHG